MTILLENRKTRLNYFIEERFEAGLVLQAWEIKAILAGRANFNGGAAFIRLTDGEAWLEAMTITPMPQASQGLLANCQPGRSRKLLLRASELSKLYKRVAERGYTIVPLELTGGRKFKLQIGLVKGKKQHDKRETIKARDLTRAQARGLA